MNTGAILNRINFGMAAAAGRLPGVDIASQPALDSLATAPRAKQVDAVISMVLNGMASPDTRAVLMSGEHPLLASAPSMSTTDSATADADEMMAGVGNGRPKNGGGKRAALQGRGLGNVPQLSGLTQIVGLALGSPEFQRH